MSVQRCLRICDQLRPETGDLAACLAKRMDSGIVRALCLEREALMAATDVCQVFLRRRIPAALLRAVSVGFWFLSGLTRQKIVV